MYGLCLQNMSFARKATFVYMYDLWNLSWLCVTIRILCVSNLCIRGTTFAHIATYASRCTLIASTCQCQLRVSIFKVVMTFDEVLACPSCCDELRWSIRLLQPSWLVAPEDLSVGFDLPSFLSDNLDFSLVCPSWRMWSSVFSLQRSWLPIGPSISSFIEGSAECSYLNSVCLLGDFYLLNPV